MDTIQRCNCVTVKVNITKIYMCLIKQPSTYCIMIVLSWYAGDQDLNVKQNFIYLGIVLYFASSSIFIYTNLIADVKLQNTELGSYRQESEWDWAMYCTVWYKLMNIGTQSMIRRMSNQISSWYPFGEVTVDKKVVNT